VNGISGGVGRPIGAEVAQLAFVSIVLSSGACGDSPTAAERMPLVDLPEDLAAVTFATEGLSTAPYTLLAIRHDEGFRGFVAINRQGEPVWSFRTTGSPAGSTRRPNGNFVLLDNESGLVEVTVDGEVVRELPQEQRPGRWIHHDVTSSPDGTVLFLAEDTRPWPDTLVTGDAVWAWDPESGLVERRWSAFDHLVPERDQGDRSRASDWLHANSLAVGPTGRVLVSLHFLDQVLSISPDFSTLVWRLGGVEATVAVDDPFSGQHTAAEVRPGRVLLFDNGFSRVDERYSRAVEYEVDGDEARKVWEWRPERDNWARVISSARRLPNGNTLVAFGTSADPDLGTTGPIEAYEVTEQGEVTWHLQLGGPVSSMYRATPLFAF